MLTVWLLVAGWLTAGCGDTGSSRVIETDAEGVAEYKRLQELEQQRAERSMSEGMQDR